jgi:hypothetical protein
MYWTKKSIYEGFDVHGFDSLAALCDEIFSLEKISHFSPENNASKYIFTVRNMKKIANEKEKEFLDLVELKIKENLKKQKEKKNNCC